MTDSSSESVRDAAIAVIRREAAAVADVADQIDDTFTAVASLLMSVTGKVIVAGVGTSSFIARRAAHLFAVSGTPSLFLHPTEGQHGSVGALRSGDVLIALSKGGESDEVNTLVNLAAAEGVRIVGLTSNGESTLGRLADHTVVLRRDDVADPAGIIALGSTLAYGAWLDAMSVVLMRARQYGWDRVLFTHPGGAVGHIRDLPTPLPPLTIPPVDSGEV